MREYIRRRQARMAEYIATRPIHELCMDAPDLPGSNRVQLWWQQNFEPVEEEAVGSDGSDESDGSDGSASSSGDDDGV